MLKICCISSSGGHWEELKMLKPLEDNFKCFYVTEKTKYLKSTEDIYLIQQINRREKMMLLKLIIILFQSLIIFYKEKPDVIISTGALSIIPMFLIGKLFKKKLIFIESFAKLETKTMTGKFVSRFTDITIIQWETMLKQYPDAKNFGTIY